MKKPLATPDIISETRAGRCDMRNDVFDARLPTFQLPEQSALALLVLSLRSHVPNGTVGRSFGVTFQIAHTHSELTGARATF